MKTKLLFLSLLLAFFIPAPTQASSLTGKILLQVEENGEAWYVYPKDNRRYFLGRPDDAFAIMRELGLGITNADLEQIPISGSSSTPGSLANKLKGYILLQVESNGEAWYVSPTNSKRYFLGRPDDAFAIMRELGLGITNANLNNIATLPKDLPTGVTHEFKTIATKKGDFKVDIIRVPRNLPNLKIQTNTADSYNCETNCNAYPLAEHAQKFNAFAAINGAYFCPPDYSGCRDSINFYYSPFYNSETGFWANEERLKWTEGPVMIFDQNNTPYFFLRTNEIYTPEKFEKEYNQQVRAAISNVPAMLHNGVNIVETQPMDNKQKTTKGYRGGFGYDDDTFYLIVAQSATVPDLAAVFEALGATTAINLDGGGSTALYYQGEYIKGPGRLLPSAVMFTVE